MSSRAGITMLELIVVLVILGLMAGVVGLAVPQPAPPTQPRTLEAAHAAVVEARRTAIRRGSPVALTILVQAREHQDTLSSAPMVLHATAFPDGSVIADAALGIDRLTGKPRRAQRATGHE